MTQTRIVLNPKYKPKAEEILEATGIDNLSQLNGTKKSSNLYRISATHFKAIKQCGDGAGDCS